MNKILSTIAATSILVTASYAADVNFDINKAYASAGLALEKPENSDVGVALVLGGGIPFMSLGGGSVVAEAELTYSILPASYDKNYPYSSGGDITYATFATYGGWKYDIDKQFYVKPRVGLIYRSIDLDAHNGVKGYSDSEIGIALGAQGGMKLTKELDLTVGVNIVDGLDLIHLTGAIQYNF